VWRTWIRQRQHDSAPLH